MIYSRNLGLHFPYLSFSFKVIFNLSNWQIQGSYDVRKMMRVFLGHLFVLHFVKHHYILSVESKL